MSTPPPSLPPAMPAAAWPPAPDFTLKAITSGRTVSRTQCAGRPLLLLFHDHDALATVEALQRAVRGRWPHASTLLVGSVVNLQAVPRMLRGVAEAMMARAFRDAARQVPAGQDPADYVLILPDGSGQVCFALGVHDGGKVPTALLIDGGWLLRGRFSGATLVDDCVAALADILPAATEVDPWQMTSDP